MIVVVIEPVFRPESHAVEWPARRVQVQEPRLHDTVEVLFRQDQVRAAGERRVGRVRQECIVLEVQAPGGVRVDPRAHRQVHAARQAERVRPVARRQRALPCVRSRGVTGGAGAARQGVSGAGVGGDDPREIVLERGQGVRDLELVALLRVRPAEPEVMDGLLDRLEHLIEVVARAPERHAHRLVAFLAGPRVLGREVEIGRHAVREAHLRLVPAHADLVDPRSRVVQAERRARSGQLEHSAVGLDREEPPGGRNEVRSLIPQEVELPLPQAADGEEVVLIPLAPLRAAELREGALVGTRQPEIEALEEEAGREVTILFELRPVRRRGPLGVESAARLDLALDVHAPELSLRRGDPGTTDEEHQHDQPRRLLRSHGCLLACEREPGRVVRAVDVRVAGHALPPHHELERARVATIGVGRMPRFHMALLAEPWLGDLQHVLVV